jgi:hypothetical protein
MVSNSLTFALFFLAVLAVLPWLRLRAANLFLLAASIVFYAAWDWRFLGLLAFSTLFNFFTGARMATTTVILVFLTSSFKSMEQRGCYAHNPPCLRSFLSTLSIWTAGRLLNSVCKSPGFCQRNR